MRTGSPKRIERHGQRFRVTWWANGTPPALVRHRDRGGHVPAAGPGRSSPGGSGRRSAHRRRGRGQLVRDHRRDLSSGTRRDYEGRIRRDVGRIGALLADDIARNPRELRAFYATLTPTNARRLHAILRQAFQDAVAHGEISRNPCDLVKARRPRALERPIPSPEEVKNMVLAAEEDDPLWGLFVNVSATIGTRRGETCALRWEDLDIETGRVHVRRAVCKASTVPPS